ncbi:hypothetical protein [Streptomyces musisoli]|uniref:hypothetical protein n=1 Tax=Streptomyces musisoli TaxID=2802280 RepID=UPI001F3B04B7|nr:hypothetical protein [Streptomyces musisoli]
MSSPTPPAYTAPSGDFGPTPPAPRFRPVSVALLVVGLVLGAGGVGAAWALSDDDPTGDGAAGDAHRACEALEGFDESDYGAKGAKGDIALNRYAAAVVLSAAAAAGDHEYKPLAEAMRRVQNQQLRFADFAEPAVQKDLKAARSLCADM